MSLNPSLSTIFQFQRLFSFFGGSKRWGGRRGPQNGFQMLISPRDKGAELPRWCLAGDPGGWGRGHPDQIRVRPSSEPPCLGASGSPHLPKPLPPAPAFAAQTPGDRQEPEEVLWTWAVWASSSPPPPPALLPGCLFPDLRCHTVSSFWPSRQPLGAPNPAGWSPRPTLLRHSSTSGPLCPDLAGAHLPQTVCTPGCL